MTGQWRLVGKELYDIQADPEQRLDVSAENPKVVKQLSAEYETWWEDISEGSEAYVPFVIDDTKQKEYTFSSQNWYTASVA